MQPIVCIAVPHVLAQKGNGAYLWIFINWALGLQACGCRVHWLEDVRVASSRLPGERVTESIADLRRRLEPFGLAGSFLPVAFDRPEPGFALEEAMLLNFCYQAPADFVQRFRKSVLVDIDPGLLQTWIDRKQIEVAPHDLCFTIGETVGTPHARFPDCGVEWLYTPPPVFLPAWPCGPSSGARHYTAVTGWWDEWMDLDGEVFSNEKRTVFLEYLALPARCSARLQLAIIQDKHTMATDVPLLERNGWSIADAQQVCATPETFRRYVQGSRGEFTCTRPSNRRLRTTWVDDRTLCYLASGKPAIVQSSAPARHELGDEGLLRFSTPGEAATALDRVEADYDVHCRQARRIAETHFDAVSVARALLSRVLD